MLVQAQEWTPNVLSLPVADRLAVYPQALREAITALETERAAPATLTLQRHEARKARVEAFRLPFALPEGLILHDVRDGRPIFLGHTNAAAARSSNTQLVRDAPRFLNVDGTGMTVGVWEVQMSTDNGHPEWSDRFHYADSYNGSAHLHAAHVIGTIAAAGIDLQARGMAPAAGIRGFDSFDHVAEMLDHGAESIEDYDEGALLVSNHSYGLRAGWYRSRSGDHQQWLGAWPGMEDALFGQYDEEAVSWDDVCWRRPYFLPFKAAGNYRDDAPPEEGEEFFHNNDSNGLDAANYDPNLHPPGPGGVEDGYDTIPAIGNAKNVLTIGAVDDAVLHLGDGISKRWLINARSTPFSSWGPSDDGRIKPDIVANGRGVYSTSNRWRDGDRIDDYEELSGTSMAAPTASGSAILLQELFLKRFPGTPMRAATLKGLIIHTADDLGASGPDYRYGWGLMNTYQAADLIERHYNHPNNNHIYEGIASAAAQELPFYWDQASARIRVTLCYTDPPGTAKEGLDNREPALVNDIDIWIVDPNGVRHDPFLLDPNAPSAPATRGDNDVDNVEQVLINDPLPGAYTLHVDADGDGLAWVQQISLILSGTQSEAPAPTPQEVRPSENHSQPFDQFPTAAEGLTYHSTHEGRILHVDGALRFDDRSPDAGDTALNTATLHLDLAGQSDVQLWVWWDDHGDSDDSLPEGPFTGSPNGDGIAISADGVTWHKVANLHEPGLLGFNVFDLDAAIAAAGISYSSHFQIRFSQFGAASYPNGGITIDRIATLLPSPGTLSFESASVSVDEGSAVELTVHRENGSHGIVSCDFVTIDVSASGSFFQTSGQLTFDPGETSKTITLGTIDNDHTDDLRRFRVKLQFPGGGATLGATAETEVTIIDDELGALLAVYPEKLQPTALAGSHAPTQHVRLRNDGGDPLHFSYVGSESWINASGSGVLAPGATTFVPIRFKTQTLSAGRYCGRLTISDDDGVNLPVEVPVWLTLGYGGESRSVSYAEYIELPMQTGQVEASQYPVTFSMPPMDGRVVSVQLVLHDIDHFQMADLDMALVSPEGKAVVVLSDGLKHAISPVTLTIADGGPPIPASGSPGEIHAPTNHGSAADAFPMLGSSTDLFPTLADLSGIRPQGTWELYIVDDAIFESIGFMAGATLRVETVALDDGLIENFKAFNHFDLDGHSLTFTPNEDPAGYDLARTARDKLPITPSGTTLSPLPDGYERYDLADKQRVSLYGQTYAAVWIGENGSVVLGEEPYIQGAPDASKHFALPRVSALFTNLAIGKDGAIHADQQADRLVITWQDVSIVATGETITFQMELFFDGRLRLTYQDVGPVAGIIVGTSRGWGTSSNAQQLDLSSIPEPEIDFRHADIVPGGDTTLIWTSQPGVLYEVQWSDKPSQWQALATVPGSKGKTTAYEITDQSGDRGFYRVIKNQENAK